MLPYRVAPPAVSAVSVREADGERTVVSHNAAGVAVDGRRGAWPARAACCSTATTRTWRCGPPGPLASWASRCMLDAGSWKPVLADLLSYVDICACSAAFRLASPLTNPVVIRTAGPDPVTWTAGEDSGEVVVPPTEARDTVGAGDVWHGAAALAVARLGRVPAAADVPAVIEFANRAAAVRIGHEGARAWVDADAPARLMRFEDLVERASALLSRERALLGICGAPAAGKSTLAERLVAALGPGVRLHRNGRLPPGAGRAGALGRTERKGAPDTFDAAGYVNLLRRLRSRPPDEIVYAPGFRRDLEEPIAGAVPVPPEVRLVVTEGNYLLLATRRGRQVRELLDEVWFLDPPEDARRQWLIDRHRAFGRSWTRPASGPTASDERNAVLINATRSAADLVVPVTPR